MTGQARRYSDSYFVGVGLGLVLLAAYCVVGRGLGASGAFSSVVASASTHSTAQLRDWEVLELLGVAAGGYLSAKLAGRAGIAIERGPGISGTRRMVAAAAGGVLMGLGAKFARGCTSGQALSGGALLSAGSWIFIATCFAAGYLLAPAARRLWR
jgi:hypothetical protein